MCFLDILLFTQKFCCGAYYCNAMNYAFKIKYENARENANANINKDTNKNYGYWMSRNRNDSPRIDTL